MSKRLLSLALALALALTMGLSLSAGAEEEGRVINILLNAQAVDLNEDQIAGWLEEKTGFKVHYDYYANNEALTLAVANGTDADLVFMSAAMYQTLQPKGAAKDISTFLADQPTIVEKIHANGWKYDTDENGAIWGIPSVDDAVYTGGTVYRTDIFADYGFEEPDTVDEFYQLLKDIKEQTGLIPLTGNEAVQPVIASGFGISYNLVYDAETDSVQSYLRNPGMKEYLAFMHKLYEEELIDPEWPVNKGDNINEKISSSKAVMTMGYHWSTLNWVNALVETGDEDAYFKTIIPLKDANGKRHTTVSNSVSNVYIVPATANDEDVPYTLAMVASRLDDETYWMFNDGIEGTHYTKDEEGIPTPIMPIFGETMTYGDKFQIGRNQFVHPYSWMARVHKSQVQYDTFYDANSKAAKDGFEGSVLAFASFPAYSEYNAALTTLCNDYFMTIIAGTEDLESSWDDFVTEWEQSGGLELEQGATEWYHNNPDLVAAGQSSYSPYASVFGYEIN
ncbi:MAG: extracellular solute-binding protein [Clostridia bacterium]|nr:extracellular solute-binding protein [Clostridia bacterium]